MPRRVFYSFHHKFDNWRAAQVRNIGVLSGNRPASDNDWEAIKHGGTQVIRAWIDDQLKGRSCTIVLIGEHTAVKRHLILPGLRQRIAPPENLQLGPS